jgi:radical SAM-linked protein
VVETILARGDYRVGELLQKAYEAGEIFTAWDSDFHYHPWKLLIEGTQFEEFLSAIGTDEPLPWDFFDVNFRKEYLKREYENAAAAVETPSCMDMECRACGGCFYPRKRKKDKPDRAVDERVDERFSEGAAEIQYRKTRIFYEKKGDFAFFSHLSMMQYVERLIRKSGILFKCTEGFHPRMKMIALPPLPVFAVGLDEVLEVFLDNRLTGDEILTRLNRASEDDDFKFKKVETAVRSRLLSRDIQDVRFEIAVPGLRRDGEKVEALEKLPAETDGLCWIEKDGIRDILELTIDYARQGQERFAKMYKVIDPEKKNTRYLTRTHVIFKPLLPQKE